MIINFDTISFCGRGYLRAPLVTQELKEVGIQADSVLRDEGTFLVLLTLLEENGETRESVEALRAEVS